MPEARKVPAKKAAAAPKAMDADRFCTEVLAHRHTGKLADIVTACLTAAGNGPTALRWQVTLDPLGDEYKGRVITEDSISLTAIVTAERSAGHSWKTLSPSQSAGDCHAILVGWLIEDEGLDVDEALALVKERVTFEAANEMVVERGLYEVVVDPKEDGTAASGPSPS